MEQELYKTVNGDVHMRVDQDLFNNPCLRVSPRPSIICFCSLPRNSIFRFFENWNLQRLASKQATTGLHHSKGGHQYPKFVEIDILVYGCRQGELMFTQIESNQIWAIYMNWVKGKESNWYQNKDIRPSWFVKRSLY